MASRDFFDIAGQFLGDNPQNIDSFQSSIPKSPYTPNRAGTTTRKLMHWLVPEGPIVQMYVNPQTVNIVHAKDISQQRTKSGFVLQYWGEKLTTIKLAGTTGTSGIEGINVLYDIYRHEQLTFDPFALISAAKQDKDTFAGNIFGSGSALSSDESITSALFGSIEQSTPMAARKAPTLASLAFTVELYWSGEVYRGYFNSFSIDESAERLGLFNYNIDFVATQKRGFRQNFLGWHRSAINGPSNSDPIHGTPHSFSTLTDEAPTVPSRDANVPESTKLNNAFLGINPIDVFSNIKPRK